MEVKLNKYGKRIFDQNIGTKVGTIAIENFETNKEKIILDFSGVDSIDTAFGNAFLSKLISKFGKEKLSKYFLVKNGNATIERSLTISLQLTEFIET